MSGPASWARVRLSHRLVRSNQTRRNSRVRSRGPGRDSAAIESSRIAPGGGFRRALLMGLVIGRCHGRFEENPRVGPDGASIKIACAVTPDGKTQDHSGGGGKGYCGNEAGETKQAAERQQRENQPHR